MSQRDDRLCLGQMLEYARIVEREVTTLSRAQFDASVHSQSVVVRFLQNIGEAAANVSRDFQNAHPQVAWSKMIGMRHWLVHGYDQIDFDIVWSTATVDIPQLITTLANLLP